MLRTILSRIAGMFSRRRIDEELDDEVREHLKLLAERFIRRGTEPTDALHAAQRQFGGVTQLKEDLRDRWGLASLDALIRDLRHAWRGLRRYPLFTATALFTLALTIGAVSTVLTLA